MRKLLIILALLCGFALSVSAQSGKITGKLTYPSDYIPPEMIVCVTRGGETYCSNQSNSRLYTAKISFRLNHRAASYEVSLPTGTYYIYGTFPRGKAPTPEMENLKAYYNDFVKCGMNVNCTSKKPIAIKVAAGRVVRGIIIGDWY
jgi:hypothetical protein